MRSTHYLLIAAFLYLFVTRLVQEGMTLPGIEYAAIANNLAHGIGSFWALRFSDTQFPVFYEQPPLMFGMQALFFKWLGAGYGTERIYCAVVTVITLVLMARIWRSFLGNTDLAKWWPIPLLIWMLNEDTYLNYTGNMLECTMTLFDLLAVLLLFIKWPVSNTAGSSKPAWVFLVGAGLALIAAFLTNGPAGLYPLAFFVIARVGNEWSVGDIAKYSLGLTLVFATVLGFFFLFEAPSLAIKSYFEQQVWATLTGSRMDNTTPHRLYMLQRFFETHTHWLVIGGVLWYFLIQRKGKTYPSATQKSMVFTALMGAAALLPLMLSPRQAPHYIVPALPWIALSLGACYAGIIGQIALRPSILLAIKITAVALMLATTGWVMINTGKTLPQGAVELGDIKELMKVLPTGGTIAFTEDSLPPIVNGYFQRYNYTAIDHEMKDHKYWMVTKGIHVADTVPQFYQIISLDTRLYDVYMKR
jgi:hypothetical protein